MTTPPSPPITALDWYATLPPPALAARDGGHLGVRRYVQTVAQIDQPALSDNLLCLHLGGPKAVRRWHGGRVSDHDVDLGALTIMPACQNNRWLTRGPVDYAHLTLSVALLEQVMIEELDREPRGFELADLVGLRDPYLEQLFARLLASIECWPVEGRLYPDSLLVVLTTHLAGQYAASRPDAARSQPQNANGGLGDWRLRHVIDYMDANLARDIGLMELTALTGLSRAQFFRGFRQSTGDSPHRYLKRLRLDRARDLLRTTSLDLAEIAVRVGLGDEARLAERFRQTFGVSPRLYRLNSCGRLLTGE